MTIQNAGVCGSTDRWCAPQQWRRAVAVCLTVVMSWVVTPASDAQTFAPPAPRQLGEEPAQAKTIGEVLHDRPISVLKASIALPTTDSPQNIAAPRLEQEGVCYQPTGLGRGWILQPYEWDATALKHLPLYFEEPNLERLGYYYGCPHDGRIRRAMCCHITEYMATVHDDSSIKQGYFDLQCRLDSHQPHNQLLQPMVSAGHFFGRVAAIPYMVGACCPHDEEYVLGADRPGSPVPYRKYYMPLSIKGMFYQGAASTGIGYLIP